MARKPNSRVVLNRSKMSRLHLAIADGIGEVARTIVEETNPPDATPFGVGLVDRGGWLVYDGTKKVDGGSLSGTQPKKPRGYKLEAGVITAIAGFTFPAKFQETGTVKQPARPFLWPVAERVAPHAGPIVADRVRAAR